MKLVDLEPRWFAQEGRAGQGVSFWCPHCSGGDRVRLGVAFKNPLDGGRPVPLDPPTLWPLLQPGPEEIGPVTVSPGVHWTRQGDTFETLSITPSVDASASGHWHGYVTGGEAR